MKSGDIVQVKTSGRDSGKVRYGIYTGTVKGGKDFLLLIFTGKGTIKLNRRSVQQVFKHIRYTGSQDDHEEMKGFLDNLEREMSKNKGLQENLLELTPQEITKQVSLGDLWRSVIRHSAGVSSKRNNERNRDQTNEDTVKLPSLAESGPYHFTEPLDVESIARIHFHPHVLTRGQVRVIGEILKPCMEKGAPYFTGDSREWGHGKFMVYSRETIEAVEKDISILESLKGKYVEWTYSDFDDHERTDRDHSSGRIGKKSYGGRRKPVKRKKRKVPKLIHEDPSLVELDDEESIMLKRLGMFARTYFMEGGWPGIKDFGLAGTQITELDKFSLQRYLEFFGWDLAGERILETPSALMEFLLRLELISWREASALLLTFIIKRKTAPFFLSFSRAAMDEAERLLDVPDEVPMDRVDLRDTICYTIDPPDAKDFDDAVGFREFTDPEDGNAKIELSVHIADVTHYVRPGSAIDLQARRRCTSVYLPLTVLPMLPARLSEDLCSLRAGVDRLAFSTHMIFDAVSGELQHWEHVRSVIRVKENLSYDQVNQMIENDPGSLFSSMNRFAQLLEKRYERLDIVTEERKIRFHEQGNELEITLKSPSPSTRMIEQFMVVTNEAVARTIADSDMPSVFRIHPLPDRPNVETWNAMCKSLNFPDLTLDIDFDSLVRAGGGNKDPSNGDYGPDDGTGQGTRGKDQAGSTGKDGDLLSMLKSGGVLTLGGFGAISTRGRKSTRDDSKSRDQKIDDEVSDGIRGRNDGRKEGEEKEYGEEEGEKKEYGEKEGREKEGEDVLKEDSKQHVSSIQLAPMDPEDLETISIAYRRTLSAVSELPEDTRKLMYNRILSTLPRAVYSINNHGHFGLNSQCYTHFTSPIRRYPDVLVHRVLGALLLKSGPGAKAEIESIDENMVGNGSIEENMVKNESIEENIVENESIDEDLAGMVEMCNDQSRAAEDLERLMIDIALATRASQDREFRKGTHDCIITGLTPTSCFLSLDGSTEGRIPLSRLSPYRLTLDESRSRIMLGLLENADEDEKDLRNFVDRIRSQERQLSRKEDLMGDGSSEKHGEILKKESSRRNGVAQANGIPLRDDDGSEEFGIELYRLGERMKCRIHSVKISEGKVDLSVSD